MKPFWSQLWRFYDSDRGRVIHYTDLSLNDDNTVTVHWHGDGNNAAFRPEVEQNQKGGSTMKQRRYAVKPQTTKAGAMWASGRLADSIEEGVMQYAEAHGKHYAVDGELIVAIAPERESDAPRVHCNYGTGDVNMHEVRLYKITYTDLLGTSEALDTVKVYLEKILSEITFTGNWVGLPVMMREELDKAAQHCQIVAARLERPIVIEAV